jgi:hypothetical protein
VNRSRALMLVLAVMALGLALSACTSKKMMQLDTPVRHAERTT